MSRAFTIKSITRLLFALFLGLSMGLSAQIPLQNTTTDGQMLVARTPLDEFLANPAVNPASTSVYIAEIKGGRVLAKHNISLPLMGASTMKLVTIASLMYSRDLTTVSPRRWKRPEESSAANCKAIFIS